MRTSSVWVAVVILLLGLLVSNDAQRKPSADLSQISALLKAHDDALNKHDIDGVMSIFASSPNTVVMGTGPGEVAGGGAKSKQRTRRFSRIDRVRSRATSLRAENHRRLRLADLDMQASDSKGGKKREYELNVSGVMRRIGGKWYIQQLHYSNLTGSGSGG